MEDLSICKGIKDIQVRIDSFEGFECAWISRKANQAADWVAKQVKKGVCLSNWVGLSPSSLVHILSRDGLPAPPC